MSKISTKILFGFVIVSLLAITVENSVFADNTSPYQHRMVKEEIQKKGGSLEPRRKPKYKILVANYAVTEQVNGFIESRIKKTLRDILHKEKAKDIYDGITVFLYRTPKNANTEQNVAMAKAEWWPKGHSFSPDNEENISDKSTYIENYEIISLPKKTKSKVNGLSVSTRKEIYKKIEAADKASREKAEKMYSKYSEEYFEKIDSLNAKAKSQILKQYNISSDTYSKIISEGINQRW